LYKRLDISIKEMGESFYNDMIPGAVEHCAKKGMVTDDNGAKCIFVGKPYKIPLIVIKSNGGYGYDSTDLACIQYRIE
jgi:arginyl-tRNA synthetase